MQYVAYAWINEWIRVALSEKNNYEKPSVKMRHLHIPFIHVDHVYGDFETNVMFGLAGKFYVQIC